MTPTVNECNRLSGTEKISLFSTISSCPIDRVSRYDGEDGATLTGIPLGAVNIDRSGCHFHLKNKDAAMGYNNMQVHPGDLKRKARGWIR